MRERFQQFMSGRFGSDGLNRTMIIASIVLIFVHMFVAWRVLYYLAMALLIFAIYRTFSRNIQRRTEENMVYERLLGNFKGKFSRAGDRAKQAKTHKFYKCPQCSQQLRVPRGRGRVSITCPKCHNTFVKKT